MKIVKSRDCIYYSKSLNGREACDSLNLDITKELKKYYIFKCCPLEGVDDYKIL